MLRERKNTQAYQVTASPLYKTLYAHYIAIEAVGWLKLEFDFFFSQHVNMECNYM